MQYGKLGLEVEFHTTIHILPKWRGRKFYSWLWISCLSHMPLHVKINVCIPNSNTKLYILFMLFLLGIYIHSWNLLYKGKRYQMDGIVWHMQDGILLPLRVHSFVLYITLTVEIYNASWIDVIVKCQHELSLVCCDNGYIFFQFTTFGDIHSSPSVIV